MKKMVFATIATAVALSAATPSVSASAATTYKVKSGKLLNAAYNKYKNMKPAEMKKFLQTTEGKVFKKQFVKSETYFKSFNFNQLTPAQLAYYSVHEKLSDFFDMDLDD